mgnify:CR=1 FL=1
MKDHFSNRKEDPVTRSTIAEIETGFEKEKNDEPCYENDHCFRSGAVYGIERNDCRNGSGTSRGRKLHLAASIANWAENTRIKLFNKSVYAKYKPGVTVEKDENSPTGYTVTFIYKEQKSYTSNAGLTIPIRRKTR